MPSQKRPEPTDVIKKPKVEGKVYSQPTMCLNCRSVQVMTHDKGADPVKGQWECPGCGHVYLFSHWKIKKQGGKQ